MDFLKRTLRGLALGLIALILLFEEWGWEPLARMFARLARLPLWALAERKIAALPKWGALLAFFVPAAALLPVKLLAIFLFGQGHAAWGLTLLLAAKLLGTAVLARLFQLTQPALMQFTWFAYWYPRWKAWKDGLLARVRASALWRMGRLWKANLKSRWHRILG
jgi:hypothetical protein